MKDSQKIMRYDLENSKEPLTPAQRVLLASLNDLREGESSGKDLLLAQQSVVMAEKAVADEGKTKGAKGKKGDEVVEVSEVTGAENVTRVQQNQTE